MKKLIITIETDADITERGLSALGQAAADYTVESLKPIGAVSADVSVLFQETISKKG